MSCPRCGGDPEIATGREAIGTPGCICGAGIRVPIDPREWVAPVDVPRIAAAGSLSLREYAQYLIAHRDAPGVLPGTAPHRCATPWCPRSVAAAGALCSHHAAMEVDDGR